LRPGCPAKSVNPLSGNGLLLSKIAPYGGSHGGRQAGEGALGAQRDGLILLARWGDG